MITEVLTDKFTRTLYERHVIDNKFKSAGWNHCILSLCVVPMDGVEIKIITVIGS